MNVGFPEGCLDKNIIGLLEGKFEEGNAEENNVETNNSNLFRFVKDSEIFYMLRHGI